VNTIEYRDGTVLILDQTLLPRETRVIEAREVEVVAEAIEMLRVRGAPAIGLAAAYGVTLAAERAIEDDPRAFRQTVLAAADRLQRTRPTAVNLFWALARMRAIAGQDGEPREIARALRAAADTMLAADEAANRAMGAFGAELIPDGARILTHCNAGALATGAYGTALGVIRAAHEQGKRVSVLVDETRPLLQGARLTAWELGRLGIPHTLITDSMAGHFMARGAVDLAVVGADRIAANGDTANKIGTYSVAVLAAAHNIPLYVAAPTSTVDLSLLSGDAIPIEQRNPAEVAGFAGKRTAPEDTVAANPAFDVTPARLIAAIVTEQGIIRPPYEVDLAAAVAAAQPAA